MAVINRIQKCQLIKASRNVATILIHIAKFLDQVDVISKIKLIYPVKYIIIQTKGITNAGSYNPCPRHFFKGPRWINQVHLKELKTLKRRVPTLELNTLQNPLEIHSRSQKLVSFSKTYLKKTETARLWWELSSRSSIVGLSFTKAAQISQVIESRHIPMTVYHGSSSLSHFFRLFLG